MTAQPSGVPGPMTTTFGSTLPRASRPIGRPGWHSPFSSRNRLETKTHLDLFPGWQESEPRPSKRLVRNVHLYFIPTVVYKTYIPATPDRKISFSLFSLHPVFSSVHSLPSSVNFCFNLLFVSLSFAPIIRPGLVLDISFVVYTYF